MNDWNRPYFDQGQINTQQPSWSGAPDNSYQDLEKALGYLRDTMLPLPPAESIGKGWQDPGIQRYAAQNLANSGIGFGSVLAGPRTKAFDYMRELFIVSVIVARPKLFS